MAKHSALLLQPQAPLGDEQVGLSGEAQTTGGPAEQAPLWQESDWVQPSPSLQLLPSALTGEEHTPVAGEHVPTV